MRRLWVIAALVLVAATASAAPIQYRLPDETAALAPGPNVEITQTYCGACHSADYVSTQPRGLPNPAAFWTGEVTQMRNVYKADIPQADTPAIVAYLVETYGK
jgi:cytochrome c553